MEKIKAHKKEIIRGSLLVIYYILIIAMFYDNVKQNPYTKDFQIIAFTIGTIIITLFSAIAILIITKIKCKPEKAFVIIGLIFGLLFIIATPALKGHDEEYYWYKSYAVSIGQPLPTKTDGNKLYNELPKKAYEIYEGISSYGEINYKLEYETLKKEIEEAKQENNNQETKYVSTTTTAFYPPIQMSMQAIGIAFARFLNLPMLLQILMGRLANLIFYLVIGYFCIKLIPSKKLLLTAFLLCPKFIYLAGTLSGDVFTNCVTILFICLIFKIIKERKEITKKQYALILILTPCIATCKLVFSPLILLLFLIPKECYKKNRKISINLCIIAFTVIIASLWLCISYGYLTISDGNTSLQIEYIMKHPIKYIITMLRTIFINCNKWMLDMVGGYLEAAEGLAQYPFVSVMVYVVFILGLFCEKEENTFNKKEKIYIIMIFLIIVILILTALYIQWTVKNNGVGSSEITGVQGRYFIPIFMLLPFAIETKKTGNNLSNTTMYLFIIMWMLPTLLTIMTRNIY